MRVLEDGSHTGHRLGIAESVLAPHTPGPPQHRHAQHDEGFYIISGTVRFTVGEKDYDATAGTLVMVPPGAPHTFANLTDQPAVMLSTFTPDLYVQYFRDLQDMIARRPGTTRRIPLRDRRHRPHRSRSESTPGRRTAQPAPAFNSGPRTHRALSGLSGNDASPATGGRGWES